MSTASSTSNRTSTSTSTADNRVAADGGAVVVGAGATANIIDGGAIELAGDVSQMALDLAYDTSQGAFVFAGDALAEGASLAVDSLEASNAALAKIIERERTETTQLADRLINIGLPVLGLVATAYFVWGKK